MSNITELEAKYQELGQEIEKLKAEECKYPKFFKNKENDYIVKFTGLEKGEEVYSPTASNIGFISNTWVSHTNIKLWEEIPYDKETGLYHKQLVWCWDNYNSHKKEIRFYNAISKSTFYSDGINSGIYFDNYKAYDWKDDFINEWAIVAIKTLKENVCPTLQN